MERYEIIVVGAGASGLMAARRAATGLKSRGVPGRVLVTEGNEKPGKKLLATGNGRCNLTNLSISPDRYHGDVEAVQNLLEAYPAQRVMAEFEKMGLLCRADEEGRVYPNSLQAAAVLHVLGRDCEEAGVELLCGSSVTSIVPQEGGFLLQLSDGRRLFGKKCVLACGGAASPKHSLGEKGYRLARELGHSVTTLSPSLTFLKTADKMPRALKGIRCKAMAFLYQSGKKLGEERGEVLFGDGSLSGICVFNLSAKLREGEKREQTELVLDLLEQLSISRLLEYWSKLKKEHPALLAQELFSGLLNLRLGEELVKRVGIRRDAPVSSLGEADLKRASHMAKELRFSITGTGTWENAQVTAGGVPLREIDLQTMESKIQPGLYLTGELLNLDGDCGGYNLHWAWATGMQAGSGAVRSV